MLFTKDRHILESPVTPFFVQDHLGFLRSIFCRDKDNTLGQATWSDFTILLAFVRLKIA